MKEKLLQQLFGSVDTGNMSAAQLEAALSSIKSKTPESSPESKSPEVKVSVLKQIIPKPPTITRADISDYILGELETKRSSEQSAIITTQVAAAKKAEKPFQERKELLKNKTFTTMEVADTSDMAMAVCRNSVKKLSVSAGCSKFVETNKVLKQKQDGKYEATITWICLK